MSNIGIQFYFLNSAEKRNLHDQVLKGFLMEQVLSIRLKTSSLAYDIIIRLRHL